MSGKVKPIPEGYHSLTPYLIAKDAAKAIELWKKAFGATEIFRMTGPNGVIGHAEIQIGNSRIMMADEHPQMGAKGPQAYGGSPMFLMFYTEDVDGMVDRAVTAGMKITRPTANQFYGDRSATLEDSFGFTWVVGTHVEDVSPEEMKVRSEKHMKEMTK